MLTIFFTLRNTNRPYSFNATPSQHRPTWAANAVEAYIGLPTQSRPTLGCQLSTHQHSAAHSVQASIGLPTQHKPTLGSQLPKPKKPKKTKKQKNQSSKNNCKKLWSGLWTVLFAFLFLNFVFFMFFLLFWFFWFCSCASLQYVKLP